MAGRTNQVSGASTRNVAPADRRPTTPTPTPPTATGAANLCGGAINHDAGAAARQGEKIRIFSRPAALFAIRLLSSRGSHDNDKSEFTEARNGQHKTRSALDNRPRFFGPKIEQRPRRKQHLALVIPLQPSSLTRRRRRLRRQKEKIKPKQRPPEKEEEERDTRECDSREVCRRSFV